jgi:glycyl-tRNA synthetase beta chain
MKTLLLEIGSEEIPAGYIQPALEALSAGLLKKMSDQRIDCGSSRTFGTPRRLAIEIQDVAEKQRTVTSEVTGPPVKVAYDADGKPTMAAVKFAEKVGLPVGKLTVKQTPKGDYICASVTERGLATRKVLQQILPEVILSLPFPKAMRWASGKIAFARPIISLLALFGSQTIPLALDGLKSGRTTLGHSMMNPGKVKVSAPEDYETLLREVRVIADFEKRRQMVFEDITRAAESVGGRLLPDNALLDVVTNLVEYPVAVAGSFDQDFLELPREILITSMREHQKYFAVVDADGNLMPNFIAVNNTVPKDTDLVRKGHQRVLRARLEDARFFYKTDLEDTPDSWVEKLHKVLFQAKLGSVYDKVQRVVKIAGYLADAVSQDNALKTNATRAAALCKADLVSQVVGEFPNLQGIMGRVYSLAAGETTDVATAIEEHYRPTQSGGQLPETLPGALVAVADKIDSICGCFHVGLIPTGAADPYALRRQSVGIVQIMLDKNLQVPLTDLIQTSLKLYDEGEAGQTSETAGLVLNFFKGRIFNLLQEGGFSKEVIAAVTEISVDHIPNVWRRTAALEALKTRPDFEPLAVAFKRVVNIIKKADPKEGLKIDESLFEDASETALLAEFNRVRERVLANLDQGVFDQALLDIASLRPAVDAFFDGVLVMAEDDRVRNNRLGLLRAIADLFALVADFSKM